ncbi:hypothetical protein BJV74DRAFT_791910, partial [Russula compacta]
EHHQFCLKCNQMEMMRHILLDCNAPAHHLIWTLAQQLWPQGHHPWLEISLGTILGIECIKLLGIRPRDNSPGTRTTNLKGRTHLLQILISEVSHLIWTTCCKHAINNEQLTMPQIECLWKAAINRRLTTDKIIATKISRETKVVRPIKDTWQEMLKGQGFQQDNWLESQEVV